jgi:hypothetical protein
MLSEEQQIADAWLVASADLGINVTTPFVLEARDGERFECIALVHQFGLPAGTVISNLNDDFDAVLAAAKELGYYASALNPHHYRRYDRTGFIETLRDWEWTGAPGSEPSWYRAA